MTRHVKHPYLSLPGKQRGVASLIISLVILTTLTFVTLYTSKTILTEQKITNNDFRARVAFEAAEAGLAAAITNLSEDPDLNTNGILDGSTATEFLFDHDGDGDREGGTDSNTITIGDTIANVTTTDLSTGGDMTQIEITSTGFSDDKSATKTVTRVITVLKPLPNTPANPVTSRGTILMQGSSTVHNQEGHTTIWTGGDADWGNSSAHSYIADVSDASYPVCMETSLTCPEIETSNKTLVGPDIIEYDTNLGNMSAEELFKNYFGYNYTQYRDKLVTVETTPANVGNNVGAASPGADLATHEVIWVEGNATIAGKTIGCAVSVTAQQNCPAADRKPSILIVNGDLELGANAVVFGLVFVTGTLTTSGGPDVVGALVSAGAVDVTGSIDVWYSSTVLENTNPSSYPASTAGSWRDI